jgi:hypothetical protein
MHDLAHLIISTGNDLFLDRLSPADRDDAVASAIKTFLTANAREPEWELVCATIDELPADRREALFEFIVKSVDAAHAATSRIEPRVAPRHEALH